MMEGIFYTVEAARDLVKDVAIAGTISQKKSEIEKKRNQGRAAIMVVETYFPERVPVGGDENNNEYPSEIDEDVPNFIDN